MVSSSMLLVRNASHELKTPLALISSRIERLMAMAGQVPEALPVLNNLMEDVRGQADLVESLLLIQRLQSQVP